MSEHRSRDKSRSRHDEPRDRSSVRRSEKDGGSTREKGHKKRDTLSVDPGYGGGGGGYSDREDDDGGREGRGSGSSRSKRDRSRSRAPPEQETLDRSFVSAGGYGSVGIGGGLGGYPPSGAPQYSYPGGGYGASPTSPAGAGYGYGASAGGYQSFNTGPEPNYAPPPSTYLPVAPAASPARPSSHGQTAQYEYTMPPAPMPPATPAYSAPAAAAAQPAYPPAQPAYGAHPPAQPAYGAPPPAQPAYGAPPPSQPVPLAQPLYPQPGAYGQQSSAPPSSSKPSASLHAQPVYGGGSGSGTYNASAPPPLPPPSPSFGPHAYPPATAASPTGPHYSSGATPVYAPPPGAYPASPTGSHGHGHTHSLSIPGMASLSIGGSVQVGGASPALQAYSGTYQSISPMPSPLMTAYDSSSNSQYHHYSSSPGGHHSSSGGDFVLGAPLAHQIHTASPSPLSPLAPPTRPKSPPYDPALHAKALLSSLTASKPDPAPINSIIPSLTANQLLKLRAEYKRIFHQVNLSKHIKLQLPSTTASPWARIVWVTSLGPWESEGWWANCWYQREGVRRELLIEALVGKRKDEIRLIKKAFKDGRVQNSLDRVVREEVGSGGALARMMDLVLDVDTKPTRDGKHVREEETEDEVEGVLGSVAGHIVNVPGGVKMDRVQEDVKRLAEILLAPPSREERRSSRIGGASSSGNVSSADLTILAQLILSPTTPHLRETIRWFRQLHGKDLAKLVLQQSPTLVGEALVHRLAGIIDKPLRDAKLLEDALSGMLLDKGGSKGSMAEDLFVSRLVRCHWDAEHMRRVRRSFAKKFRGELEDRVVEVLGGSGGERRWFREFAVRLVESVAR
ncbi:hypothetical protein DFH27DRAFT_525370 [Peziza echinospora]|nr:hypothetical protein DFH27DRAFT_525370 [Peziza echinospora]